MTTDHKIAAPRVSSKSYGILAVASLATLAGLPSIESAAGDRPTAPSEVQRTTKSLDRYIAQTAPSLKTVPQPSAAAIEQLPQRQSRLGPKLKKVRDDLDQLRAEAADFGCSLADDSIAAQVGLPDLVSGQIERGKATMDVLYCAAGQSNADDAIDAKRKMKLLQSEIEKRKKHLEILLAEAKNSACTGGFWSEISSYLFGADRGAGGLSCNAGDMAAPPVGAQAPKRPLPSHASVTDNAPDLQVRTQTWTSDAQHAEANRQKTQRRMDDFCNNCR